MIRIALLWLAVLLCGCLSASVPTQGHPTCSWSSAVPSNADVTCRAVFRTLAAVVSAQARGDAATIARLVPVQAARVRIMRESRYLRTQQARDLHAVPSITLKSLAPRRVEAQYYLLGRTPTARINTQESVELRLRGNTAVIVRAQPGVVNAQAGEG